MFFCLGIPDHLGYLQFSLPLCTQPGYYEGKARSRRVLEYYSKYLTTLAVWPRFPKLWFACWPVNNYFKYMFRAIFR